MRASLSIAGLALVLLVFNILIFNKERSLAEGQVVYMELLPADPRSLMQGDYMRLRYKLAGDLSLPDEGTHLAYLQVGSDRIATRLSNQPGAGNVAINVLSHDGRITLGAESYFFEEGSAQIYARARYGVLRIDRSGSVVLSGLLDENLKPLEQ